MEWPEAMSKKPKQEIMDILKSNEKELPYEIPGNWCWSTIDDLFKLKSGRPVDKNDEEEFGEISYVKVSDMNLEENQIEMRVSNKYVKNIEKYRNSIIPSRSVIFPKRGGAIFTNKKRLVTMDILCDLNIMAVIPPINVDERFLFYWFLTVDLAKLNNGSSVPQINNKDIGPLSFPLPPLNEQKRIADKVGNLLLKINAAKSLIKEAKETFELRRAAILDKAFRGELTAKWREENNLEDSVLEEVIQIKDKIKSYGRNSNTLKIMAITQEETPLKLPKSWSWIKLGELSYYVTSGSRDWSKYYSDTGVMFIRTQDINTNKLILEDVAYMDLPDKVEGKRSLIEKYDILTTITGANVGKCALVDIEIDEAYVSQSVALTKLVDKEMAKYIHYSLLSPIGGGAELLNRAYGIGRPVLSLEDIKNITIPLAPKNERKKMVKLIDNFLDLNDKANEIIKIEENLDHLKSSIMVKAFRGELGTNDPKEECALELLKELLSKNVGR